MNTKKYIIKNKHNGNEGVCESLKSACNWGALNYNSVRSIMNQRKTKVFENQVYILKPYKND